MKSEENREYSNWLVENAASLERPALYQVVVHNDDFTPLAFVVSVLEKYFYLDRRQAVARAMDAHVEGMAICGVFSKDFAESKVQQVLDFARGNDHPLFCSMEAA